jgi:hypothetical protein
MMSSFNKLLFTLAIVACSASSNAATIYGNNFSFTFEDSLSTLFGTPAVSGDSLIFAPSDFSALSLNGNGQAFTSSSFVVKIASLNNKSIDALALTETGDYLREGAGAKLAVGGELRAVDLAHPFVSNVGKITSGPFVETEFGDDTANWEANASLAFSSDTTSIWVTIQNILRAKTSAVGELAFIQKKFVGLTVVASQDVPVTVPLPQAVWMFGVGLFGLLSVSKRKKLL